MPKSDHEAALKKQKRKIEKYERLISDNDKLQNLANELSVELIALKGKQFKDGNFKLSFLEDMKKSSDGLGQYKTYSNRVMTYSGGGYCWEISAGRSTQLSLVCSSENKLINVLEVATFQFQAVFATSAVCSQDDIVQLANMTIPELTKLAAML
jgi:hypothetical protein